MDLPQSIQLPIYDSTDSSTSLLDNSNPSPHSAHLSTLTLFSPHLLNIFPQSVIQTGFREYRMLGVSYLQSLIICKSFDILAETWLYSMVQNNEVIPSKYTVYHHDRVEVESFFCCVWRSQLLFHWDDHCWTFPNPTTASLLHLYPLASLTSKMFFTLRTNCLQLWCHRFWRFQYTRHNWSTLSAHSPFSSSLIDLIFMHNRSEVIVEPTHLCWNILDLILKNQPNRITSTSVDSSSCSSASDHPSDGQKSKDQSKPRPVLNYARADLNIINSYLMIWTNTCQL